MKIKTLSYLVLILLIFFAGVVWGLYQKIQTLQDQLQTVLSQKDSLIVINEQTKMRFAKQLKLEREAFNQEMSKVVATLEKKYNQQVFAYTQLLIKYRARKDSVATRDSIITVVYRDTSQAYKVRKFSTWIEPNELYVAGWFETSPPFRITFEDIFAYLYPELVLTRDRKTKRWAVTVTSNSWFADINPSKVLVDSDLQIIPKWTKFLGAGGGKDFFQVLGGVGYYSYSIYSSFIWTHRSSGWTIGLMKTW